MTGEKSKGFRINIVDILITVIIAAVITLAAVMIVNAFGVDASADKSQLQIEYTIQFKGIMGEFGDKVSVGDVVVDAQKRLNLGTVTAVKAESYVKDVFDAESGEMVSAIHPDYITLDVTLVSDGYLNNEMYYVNGIKMGVGSGISIHSKNFAGTGYVSKMLVK